MKFVRLWREPTLSFAFEGGFTRRWCVHPGRVRAPFSLIQLLTSTAFRHALRACWRPTFVSRDKSRQKRFLQAAEGCVAGRWDRGLGVRHRALLRDLLVRAE